MTFANLYAAQQKDRIRDRTRTSGASAFVVLNSPPTGYSGFTRLSNGDTCFYVVVDTQGRWAVYRGTWDSVNLTLSRAEFVDSSTGSDISWDSDTKQIFLSFVGQNFRDLLNEVNVKITSTTLLNAIKDLVPAADRYIYFTSASAATLGTITSYGRSLIATANAAAAKTLLAITGSDVANTPAGGITATTVQDAINELDTKISPATDGSPAVGSDKVPITRAPETTPYYLDIDAILDLHRNDSADAHAASAITNTPAGNIVATTVQGAINELDTKKQPLDAGLTDIAALAATDGNFIVGDGANWGAESGATARTSLGLGDLAVLNTVGTSQIDNGAVTKAKLENVAADRLLGRGSGGGAGAPQEIVLGTGLSMSGTTLNASATGITAADQTEMEAASSNTVAATPGNLKWHPGVSKAGCRFNGTGTPAIVSSYNASSITDHGTGDWTINWAISFSSADWRAAVSCSLNSASNLNRNVTPFSYAVNSIRLRGWNSSVGAEDLAIICLEAFGDI